MFVLATHIEMLRYINDDLALVFRRLRSENHLQIQINFAAFKGLKSWSITFPRNFVEGKTFFPLMR